MILASRADPSIVRGRRREHSRHRSSGGSGLPGWVAWTLRSGMPLISLLPALIAVVLVQSLNPAAQRVPTGEGRFTVGGSWAAAQPGAIVGYQHWTTTPVIGWLQLGALEKALLGGTAQSVLAAVHGAMLLVTLAAVVLLWFVLRRAGASGLAAGAATAAFGITPIGVVAHTSVVVVNLALVWLLAAALLVLSGHGSVASVAAGAATGAAVLTAPLSLVAVPAIAWALVQPMLAPTPPARDGGDEPGRPSWRPLLGAAAGFAVALLGGAAAALLLSGQPGGASSVTLNAIGAAATAVSTGPTAGAASALAWLVVDPLSLLLGLIAVILAAWSRRLLPVVALAVLVAVVSFWPAGHDPVGPVALMLPVFAVAIAAAIDRAVAALGQPRFLTSLLGAGWLMAVAALLVVSAVVWATSLGSLRPGTQQPIARTDRWLRSSVPAGQLVLVDLATWPDLARDAQSKVGWYAPGDHAPAPSSAPWSNADYVVAGRTGLGTSTGAAAETMARSVPVVRFGTGPSAVEVSAVRDAPPPTQPTTPTPAEKRAAAMRRQTGAELAQNPRLSIDGADRALLTAGDVDSRVAIVLGQLLASHPVRVGGFPAVDGDAPGLRRQVLISALDGHPVPQDTAATGLVLRYLSGLRGDFATSTIDATDAGVLATFAPDPTFVPSS